MIPWREPPPAVDWGSEASVAAWIDHVRWNAFFSGARGEEITRAEAKELVAALALAAGSRRAKTPQAVECEASQSGAKRNAQNRSED